MWGSLILVLIGAQAKTIQLFYFYLFLFGKLVLLVTFVPLWPNTRQHMGNRCFFPLHYFSGFQSTLEWRHGGAQGGGNIWRKVVPLTYPEHKPLGDIEFNYTNVAWNISWTQTKSGWCWLPYRLVPKGRETWKVAWLSWPGGRQEDSELTTPSVPDWLWAALSMVLKKVAPCQSFLTFQCCSSCGDPQAWN